MFEKVFSRCAVPGASSCGVVAALFLALLGGPARAQAVWTQVGDGPVLQLGLDGAWDANSAGINSVLFDGETYWAWYSGDEKPTDGTSAIGVATSQDGLTWTKPLADPVLVGVPDTWEWTGLYGVQVLENPSGEGFKMWYSSNGGAAEQICRIGLATSPDGMTWTKHDGAVLVGDPGPSHERMCADNPSVLHDGERYRMWYWTGDFNDTPWFIGHATSDDGITWVKHPDPVLAAGGDGSTGIGFPRVLYHADASFYEMWYTIFQNGARSVGYATSTDGIDWLKVPEYIFQDDFSTRQNDPEVLFDGETYTMWYGSRDANERWSTRQVTSPWELPRPTFSIDVTEGTAPVAVHGVGSSVTPAESIVSYEWDFGDGATATGPEFEHVYTTLGEHTVKLTVTDSAGQTNSVGRKVLVRFPTGPVEPWTSGDVGTVSSSGGAHRDGERLEILGATGTLGPRADRLHFVHQEVAGSFRLVAHVLDWTSTATGSSAGIMVREGLDPGARHASLIIRNRSDSEFDLRVFHREEEGGPTRIETIDRLPSAATWLRVDRVGDSLVTRHSSDGEVWIRGGSVELPSLADELSAGFTMSVRSGDLGTAIVEDMEISDSGTTLEDFLRGDCDGTGSVELTDGIFLLTALFLDRSRELICPAACDSNRSGALDVTTAIFTFNHLFLPARPPLPPPFPSCGPGTEVDVELGCNKTSAGCF